LTDAIDLEEALRGLVTRISSLRDARSAYPGDPAPTLDAALAELETAKDLLGLAVETTRSTHRRQSSRDGGPQREHKLLRQVYRTLPVAVVILDASGTIRRVNAETSRLLGSPAGYLTGRGFAMLVDGSRRAAFRSHLTSVLHGDESAPAAFVTRLVHQGRTHTVRLVLTRLQLPGEPQEAIAAVALPVEVEPPGPAPAPPAGDDPRVLDAARRYELMSRLTRLLQDEESLRLPVAVPRTAHLLAAGFADWVIAHVGSERAAVAGPADQPIAELRRALEVMDPAAMPLAAQVRDLADGAVHEMLEDEDLLGALPDGTPAARAMAAGSALAVPIRAAGETLGVLALVRRDDRPPFSLADLALALDAGEHLGLALRARSSFASRSRAADALRTGVLPRTLPDIPGFETAAAYRAGSAPDSIGAEFYDVFPVADGWGFVLGGAAGKGEEAAAVSAMVRGGFRMLSVGQRDPAKLAADVNDALVAQRTGLFVMAVAGFVRTGRASGRVRLASAGHHPAAILRGDGDVRFTSGGGVPLGFEAGAQAMAEEVTLAEGDSLVLYSDGLVNAAGGPGERYGDMRLTEVLARCAGLPPAGVVQAIEEDHRGFREGRAMDEMTVLVLRRGR
jgi:PAS domain S-box-containing protein